ncbi:MAG: SipW-dependent-type signal peptide-containing protein [Bifidobacteriaceae bacterium]|jgi:predicted ribosomally synthesized peptide with SipW-like signal peptide|nr:SipW-dependent-type signal peptide-containing protein [Bifidobacteriaceae bacterium]
MTRRTRARRVKGLIAGACGAALMLAGGTWALWYDSENVTGGWITAGNLDIAKAGAETVWDISTITGVNDANHDWDPATGGQANRADQQTQLPGVYDCLARDYTGAKGHPADLQNGWTASPGDTILSVWPYHVALQGDNLVADLVLQSTNAAATFEPNVISAFSATVYIRDDTQAAGFRKHVLVSAKPADPTDPQASELAAVDAAIQGLIDASRAGTARFTLQAENEPAGALDPNIQVVDLAAVPTLPGTPTPAELAAFAKSANVCLVLEGTFSPTVKDRDATLTELLVFDDYEVSLEQTRKSGLGSF